MTGSGVYFCEPPHSLHNVCRLYHAGASGVQRWVEHLTESLDALVFARTATIRPSSYIQYCGLRSLFWTDRMRHVQWLHHAIDFTLKKLSQSVLALYVVDRKYWRRNSWSRHRRRLGEAGSGCPPLQPTRESDQHSELTSLVWFGAQLQAKIRFEKFLA